MLPWHRCFLAFVFADVQKRILQIALQLPGICSPTIQTSPPARHPSSALPFGPSPKSHLHIRPILLYLLRSRILHVASFRLRKTLHRGLVAHRLVEI
jgi:hypothetical protein